MKLAILTSVVVIFSAGVALAGANNMTSGRPSAVLNDTQCQAIWTMAIAKWGNYLQGPGGALHRQLHNG